MTEGEHYEVKKIVPIPDIELKIPEKTNIAWEACDRRVEEGKGERVFLYHGDREITYRQLQTLQNKVGNALKESGVRPGDSVMFRSPNSVELFASILGAMKIGAIAVPSQTLFGEREVAHLIANSDSVFAFAAPECLKPIEAVRARFPALKQVVVFGQPTGDQLAFGDFIDGASDELDRVETHRDDVAYILYTSGSSGLPKGVVRTHRDTYTSGIPTAVTLGLTSDDVFLHPFELSFGFVFGTLAAVNYTGCRMVLYPGRTTAEGVVKAIEKYRVTKFSGVPSLFRMILAIPDLEKKYDLSSLQLLEGGGEVLPPDTYQEIRRRLKVECFDGYGQTEGFYVVSQRSTFPIRIGSMGKEYPGIPIGVVDDGGNPCSPRQVGHLVVGKDCPILCKEYRKMPREWAAVFRYPGWYDTGDVAYFDEDGYYFWVGRSDDMIKSRGYLVSPKEVEDTIMELPGILEVAAVGAPDGVIGNRIKVFISLRPGYEATEQRADAIRGYVSSLVAPYKVPKDIEFVPQIPKTPTGKISRKILRQLEEERHERGEKVGHRYK